MNFKKVIPNLFGILLISIVANYNVPNLDDANWDTVLFLTPYGIFHNFLNADNSVLWTFYFDVSAGQINLNLFQSILIAVIYIFMIASFYFILSERKSR